MENERRKFIELIAKGVLSLTALSSSSLIWSACTNNPKSAVDGAVAMKAVENKPFFDISLAEWSLHKTLRAGKLTNMEFPAKSVNDFGIKAVEYVNQFFKDKAKDMTYLSELKQRTDDLDVKNVLIMIDGEGSMASSDEKERTTAVENHYKWVEAAQYLGCHAIRVNLYGEGTSDEVATASVKSLSTLTQFAKEYGISIVVENHGGYSSQGAWLANVMKSVNMSGCGTLPDFGNFCVTREEGKCLEEYDRYLGVKELMPYAKGVSAKTGQFDENGLEARMDYFPSYEYGERCRV